MEFSQGPLVSVPPWTQAGVWEVPVPAAVTQFTLNVLLIFRAFMPFS
jgi:hypothetical protein